MFVPVSSVGLSLFFLPCCRYMFELARRHTNVPDVFLGKLYDASENVIEECCSAKDASSCLDGKVAGRGAFCFTQHKLP